MILHLLGFFVAFFLTLTGAVINTAWAQTAEDPIEINADETLTWDRVNKEYKAQGNVVATQGQMNLEADQVTAYYADKATGGSDISKMIATGNPKVTMPDKVLTANNRIEYFLSERRIEAIGRAFIQTGNDTITADTIIAWLDANNKLERAEGNGNVIITTPKETATANRATYSAKDNKAILFNNVDIKQGQNNVKGARAEIDLTNNISKVFGSETDGERVKAIFYPK
jgi:lipopolysaccharide export system protein LptA